MPSQFSGVRLWLKISSYFGILMMIILVGVYFYGVTKANSPGGVSQAVSAAVVTSYKDLGSIKVLLFIFLIWSSVKTLVCNIGLIRYASAPDEEFIANKWALAVLSLSIGGFLAPFFLTHLPNTETKATKNARTTIVRYMGLSWALAGIVTLIAMFILKSMIPAANHDWTSGQEKNFYVAIGCLAGLGVLAGLTCAPFFSKNVANTIKTRSEGYHFYNLIMTGYVVIVTIELIALLCYAIFNTFVSIARAINSQNGFEAFFNILSAILNIVYTIYLMRIITAVIRGLWARETPGYITIKKYERLTADNKQVSS